MYSVLLLMMVTVPILVIGLIMVIGAKKKWKPLFDKPTELEKLFVFSPKLLRDFFGEKALYYYYIIFGILFMLGSICFFVYLVFIF